MDIYGVAIDDKLLIEGSVRLFFETWLLSHCSMSECGERYWSMGRQSVLFDWKRHKSLFFEIPLYVR